MGRQRAACGRLSASALLEQPSRHSLDRHQALASRNQGRGRGDGVVQRPCPGQAAHDTSHSAPAGRLTGWAVPQKGHGGRSDQAPGAGCTLVLRSEAITPAGVITEFPTLTAGSAPNQIATGPDGNLWVTLEVPNHIASVTPTGVVTEFPVLTGNALLNGIAAVRSVSASDPKTWRSGATS